jgi:hypothetical protein
MGRAILTAFLWLLGLNLFSPVFGAAYLRAIPLRGIKEQDLEIAMLALSGSAILLYTMLVSALALAVDALRRRVQSVG